MIPDQHPDEETRGEYISRAEVEEMLRERDTQHSEQLARIRSVIPAAMVPAHSGGPGIDQHQPSWSLAEQELATRGDWLDHWDAERP